MIKPKKEICDREYYSHILDVDSIGTILLDNTYYKSTNNKIFGIVTTFKKNDYNVIHYGNEYEYSIYHIYIESNKNSCQFIDTLLKPEFTSIYKLSGLVEIDSIYNIFEIVNNSVKTVKRLYSNQGDEINNGLIDISKFISSNNMVYLYTDHPNCSVELYNCLYFPDITDTALTYPLKTSPYFSRESKNTFFQNANLIGFDAQKILQAS
jgi:hypothetical protein